jgi:hypothetical protein
MTGTITLPAGTEMVMPGDNVTVGPGGCCSPRHVFQHAFHPRLFVT